jgi:hypothetical protein
VMPGAMTCFASGLREPFQRWDIHNRFAKLRNRSLPTSNNCNRQVEIVTDPLVIALVYYYLVKKKGI